MTGITKKEQYSRKMRKYYLEHSAICQYTHKGFLKKVYKNKEELEQAGFSFSLALRCMRYKCKESQGYVWRLSTKPFDAALRNKITSFSDRPVKCYSLEKEYIKTYPTIAAAARAVNGKSQAISRCCAGGRKTAYGFIWKYVKKFISDSRAVDCFNKEHIFVRRYKGVGAAARDMSCTTSQISYFCSKPKKLYLGYYWNYADDKGTEIDKLCAKASASRKECEVTH